MSTLTFLSRKKPPSDKSLETTESPVPDKMTASENKDELSL